MRQEKRQYLRFQTLVTGEPANSFSRNTGIAIGPNAGVALRHDLSRVYVNPML